MKQKPWFNPVPPLDHESGWFEETIIKFLEEKNCIPANFFKWMNGQTTGFVDGKTIYYTQDVLKYLNEGGLFAKITD